jgi:hypothetical protein
MDAVHIWEENGEWYWDDAEDHGGFDRCVPSGPFPNRLAAIIAADPQHGDIEIREGKPPHYDGGC